MSLLMLEYQCSKCKKELDDSTAYEYRGVIACGDCFDAVTAIRDAERQEIIEEEGAKTEPLKGLDLSPDTPIGRANREIHKSRIEICSKESPRLKKYEGRE